MAFLPAQIKEKKKNTCTIKYGDKNFNNREKSKQTCIKKYGVDNISKLEEIKEKVKNSNMVNFGYDYYTMNPTYKDEFNRICIERFGATNYTKSYHFYQKLIEN